MNKIRTVIAFVFFAFLAGCALAPTYEIPKQAVPNGYKEAGPWQIATPSDQLLRGDWWQLFNDQTLNSLEEQINTSSQDLAAALARYNQSKAYEVEATSAMYPTVQAIGGFSDNRQSDNRPLRGSNQPDVYGANILGLSASYELDLWDRVHNLVASSKASLQASAADMESVRLALHSDLANDYMELRYLDAEQQLLERELDSYLHQLKLIEDRYHGGIASAQDVARAQTQLEEARTAVADIIALRALWEHAIAALIGEPASTFSIARLTIDITPPQIPVSVPSTLLQRRPDIASAERRVAAANADIGVARAAFFPSITLGLSGGFQSTGISNLLTFPNSFWSIGPAAILTIFDAGRRQAEVERAGAIKDEATAQYKATVLRAFKEVEDNLALLRQLHQEATSEQAAVISAQRSLDLATNRYREGIVSYLEVLAAEEAELRTKRNALEISTRSLLASIGLIRAIGGGWSVNPEPSTTADPNNAKSESKIKGSDSNVSSS